MRAVTERVQDAYFCEGEAAVLTPESLLRLSVPATIVVQFALDGASWAHVVEQSRSEYPGVDPEDVTTGLREALAVLVAEGLVRLDPDEEHLVPELIVREGT